MNALPPATEVLGSMTTSDPTPKVCLACREALPRSEYRKDKRSPDGLRARCAKCQNAQDRAWRVANQERSRAHHRNWEERHPERVRGLKARQREVDRESGAAQARWKVQTALRTGRLVRPDRCEGCQADGRIEAHHEDYAQPLEVQWLCCRCHKSADQRRAGQ